MITIGTRGSKLALVQADIVKNAILKVHPKLKIETKIIRTEGDKNLEPIPLDIMGKGWFTKEVEKELQEGKVDIAVHSLKDVPNKLPRNLHISAVLKRADARDVFVSCNNETLGNLKKYSKVATDSLRRKIQILKIRPDLRVVSVRGNIPTRLQKLDSGQFDGLVLAAAGLIRLKLKHRISQYFSQDEVTPAPGQGALAVETRLSDAGLNRLVRKISDSKTEIETREERLFSSKTGGNCKLPVGAYAKIRGTKITLRGFMSNIDGSGYAKESVTGNLNSRGSLGVKLALKLLKKSKNEWLSNVCILLTRSEDDNKKISIKLKKYGATTYSIPAIKFALNTITKSQRKTLQSLNSFDYCIFTSSKGVEFLQKYYGQNKIRKGTLDKCKIVSVGTETAKTLRKHHLKISLIPSQFSNKKISKKIGNIKGKKIVLIRSDISDKEFKENLIRKGAEVFDIPIYKTSSLVGLVDGRLRKIENHDKIDYIFFTSPSGVKGFLKRIFDKKIREIILTKPVISIGPTTSKEVQAEGFKTIHTAKISTTDGMIDALKKITHAEFTL